MIDRFPLGNTIRQLWNDADRYAASQTITTSADISQSLPESALVLEMLEGQIQLAAKRLTNATGVNATSLDLREGRKILPRGSISPMQFGAPTVSNKQR